MKFYTVSTFRNTLESLMQKLRDGYMSVVGDICKAIRMIVDFVASMTDKYSVELYQTLSGNSL